MLKLLGNTKKVYTFVPTVLATLPIRTASQGESFAFNSFLFQNNTPSTPLNNAHMEGFLFINNTFSKYDLF